MVSSRERMIVEPDVYTVAEFCELKRLQPNTVISMIRRGELPGERWGRSWRIPKSAVDRPSATT